jgi:hypothetical protein
MCTAVLLNSCYHMTWVDTIGSALRHRPRSKVVALVSRFWSHPVIQQSAAVTLSVTLLKWG